MFSSRIFKFFWFWQHSHQEPAQTSFTETCEAFFSLFWFFIFNKPSHSEPNEARLSCEAMRRPTKNIQKSAFCLTSVYTGFNANDFNVEVFYLHNAHKTSIMLASSSPLNFVGNATCYYKGTVRWILAPANTNLEWKNICGKSELTTPAKYYSCTYQQTSNDWLMQPR